MQVHASQHAHTWQYKMFVVL